MIKLENKLDDNNSIFCQLIRCLKYVQNIFLENDQN